MGKNFFLILFFLTWVSVAHASQEKRIELTDGSVLDGEIVSFSEGQYTVKNSVLGVIRVEGSKIRAIHGGDQTTGSSERDVTSLDAATVRNEMQKLQPAMVSNPDIMKSLASLISDSDFQALLKDPQVMDAARSLDLKTLMANEKFISILNKPEVNELARRSKKQHD
ncbi:MAG TPA: hypothetical protein PLO78_09865 [Candidatus Omnitrophota bacterium]|nr:hypothetical protein [Candidatus Omnitrophota bacterium]